MVLWTELKEMRTLINLYRSMNQINLWNTIRNGSLMTLNRNWKKYLFDVFFYHVLTLICVSGLFALGNGWVMSDCKYCFLFVVAAITGFRFLLCLFIHFFCFNIQFYCFHLFDFIWNWYFHLKISFWEYSFYNK